MTKIEVDALGNVLIKNFTQTRHFIDLYSEYIYGNIEDDLNRYSDEPLEREFGRVYASWAQEEVLKVGLVTIYHCWEKQLKALLKQQADRLELTIPNKKKQSFNLWAKKVLETQFSCFFVETSIWDIIDEMRMIVNAYKHEDSDGFETLYKEYPHYFPRKGVEITKPFDEKFLLGIDNFQKLTDTVVQFWEKIPHTVKFR